MSVIILRSFTMRETRPRRKGIVSIKLIKYETNIYLNIHHISTRDNTFNQKI